LKDVKFKPKVGGPVLVFGADFTWIRFKDNLVILVYDKDSPHADPNIDYLEISILGYATVQVDFVLYRHVSLIVCS
jgi:hypothetical protein